MRAACSGSLRMVESASTLIVSGFLVARSLTVNSPVWGLIAVTEAAIWRKVAKAIFSAWMVAPSSVLVPMTLYWAPVFISADLLGFASLTRDEWAADVWDA